MIIECGSCNARFRLDEGKITGRGVRVRCRRCGNAIVVMKEEGSGAAPPGVVSGGFDLGSALRQSGEPLRPERPGPGEAAPAPPPLADEAATLRPESSGAAGGGMVPPPEAPAAALPPSAAASPVALPDASVAAAGAAAFPPTDEAPPSPAEEAEGAPEEVVDFEKVFAAAMKDSLEAPPEGAKRPPSPPEAAGSRAAERPAPGEVPPPIPGGAEATPPSEFVMSTSDSLDFIKEIQGPGARPELDVSGVLRHAPEPGRRPPIIPPVPPAPPLETSPARPRPQPEEREARPGIGRDIQPPLSAPGEARTAPRPLPRRSGTPLQRGHGSRLARPSVVLVLLLLMLAGGGAAYLWVAPGGREALRDLLPWARSLLPARAGADARFVVVNPIGYYEVNGTAGRIFIVRGEATNGGNASRPGVRVRAALLGAGERPLAERTAYGGNVLPANTLRTASREKIEAAMGNRVGEGFSNVDVSPGKTVPFMVVFFDVPEGIEAYRVDAADVE